MLKRLYVHNYRCLENFELNLESKNSTLLVGKNGAGKSTIGQVLNLLQQIGRGINRTGELVRPKDNAQGKEDAPIRIEIEAELGTKNFKYELALILPFNFREHKVLEEKLMIGNEIIFSRIEAKVEIYTRSKKQPYFFVDWHMISLPIIQAQSEADPIQLFKTWLAQMIILAPIPSLMNGNSNNEGTLLPLKNGSNFGEWFSSLLNQYPAAYTTIDEYIRAVMPDLRDIQNPLIAKDVNSLYIQFNSEANNNKIRLHFDDLSDGEKCIFLCAVVIAANKHYGPLFCFWDEPDNYLSLSEVGHFITSLRRSFLTGGQLLMTSHNSEAIRKFSKENILLVDRKSHLEPTTLKSLDKATIQGDLISALTKGEL